MNKPTHEQWQMLVSAVKRTIKEGIGIKCPFCDTIELTRIESGIVQLKCGTRIAMTSKDGKHTVTFNGHALGVNHTFNDRYPYKLFDCNP